ncbi:MAG: glycosyltransferase [Bacteroidales bacterium]|nr:MAG: glycosyltransferase [Bacteroidales bacterium]
MKILQLCNKFPYPPKDGGAIAIYNLTKGLSNNGHDVTLLAMNTRKHYVVPGEAEKALKDIAELEYVNINTNISIVKALINLLFSRIPYNAERFISDKFTKKIISILNENKFDIIQIEGLYLTPYIKVIRQYSDAGISYRAHNIEHEIWERIVSNERNYFKKMYLKMLAGRVKNFEINSLNSYDLLVPITHRDALILNNLGNHKPFKVSPAGFDIKKVKSGNNNVDPRALFFLGSLDWIPNQEGIIWFIKRILPGVIIKNPDVRFFIAGRNAPDRLIRKITKNNNIIFLGEVEDAFDYMKNKAIMIVPLFSGSGMRVKIIEGMALGKAVVTTSTGAEGIDARHYENIIIADSETDFEKEIVNLLENKSFFTKIGENAQKFIVENMDNNKITAELAKFYKANLK